MTARLPGLRCLLVSILMAPLVLAQGAADFQTRQTWTFGQDGVSFTNNFSGARLNGVTRTGTNTYRLSITPETTPINDSPWYAFRIWSTVGRTVTLTLVYTGGHHRYNPKTTFNNWETFTTFSSSNVTVSADETEATFSMPISPTVRMAAAQPLISLEDQMAWANSFTSLPFVTASTIGNSLQGRPIMRLDANTAPAGASQTLILMTGQHPAETTGVRAFRNFVETVLADTPLARQFRRRFNIVMFPLMNPDGWYHGHWRGNANGVDTNHYWAGNGNPVCPETTQGLAAVRSIPNPAAFIDFHSTGTNIFYTGTDDAEEPTYFVPEFLAEVATRVPDWPWGRGINESGEGSSSRSWVATEIDCASMTWEYADGASSARIAQSPVEGANALMTLMLKLWANKEAPDARYDFENAASLGMDTAGAHPASVTGTPVASSSAPIGNGSISFQNPGAYLSVPDFDYGSAGTTLSLWFQADAASFAASNFTYLFSHGTSTDSNNLSVYHRSSGVLRVRVQDADDGLDDIDIPDSLYIGDGKWHHIGVTIARGVGSKVYFDGVLKGSTLNGGDGIDPAGPIRIGTINSAAASGDYRGRLDDLRIYQRALTPYQLTAIRHVDAPAEPYLDWKDQAFSTLGYSYLNPSAADHADPDGDGMENVMENALGGNPLVNDAPLVMPRLRQDSGSGDWYFEYRRRRAGSGSAVGGWNAGSILYRTWSSTDLSEWTTGTGALVPHAAPTVIDADFETATLKAVTPGAPARFFRLEAVRDGN